MKNFFILLAIISFLFSCSKTNQKESIIEENELELDSISIVFNSDLDQTNADAVVLSLNSAPGSFVRQRIYFSNQSGSNITIGDLSTSLQALRSDLSISRNRCPSVLGNRRLCYVDIRMDYTEGVSVDETLYLLPIGGTDETSAPNIALISNVNETYATELSNSGESIIKGSEVLNFGTLVEGESSTRRLYFVNENSLLDLPAPTLPATLPDGISQVGTNCIGDLEKDGGICYIDVRYDYQGIIGSTNEVDTNITLESDNMSEANKNLQIIANNVAELDPNAPKVSVSEINISAQNRLIGDNIKKRIYVSNIVNQDIDLSQIVGNLVNGATVLASSCTGTLKKGSYCYLDIQIDIVEDEELPAVSFTSPELNIDEQIAGAAPIILPLVIKISSNLISPFPFEELFPHPIFELRESPMQANSANDIINDDKNLLNHLDNDNKIYSANMIETEIDNPPAELIYNDRIFKRGSINFKISSIIEDNFMIALGMKDRIEPAGIRYIMGERCELIYRGADFVGNILTRPIYDENNSLITLEEDCLNQARALYGTNDILSRDRTDSTPNEKYYLPSSVDTIVRGADDFIVFNYGSSQNLAFAAKRKLLESAELRAFTNGFFPNTPYQAFAIRVNADNPIYPHNGTTNTLCNNISPRYSDFFGICNGSSGATSTLINCLKHNFVYSTHPDGGNSAYCSTNNQTMDIDPADGTTGTIISQNCVLDRTGEDMFNATQVTTTSPNQETINFSTDTISCDWDIIIQEIENGTIIDVNSLIVQPQGG